MINKKMKCRDCLDISINIKVEFNFIKFIQRAFIAWFELLILIYSALLDFHRVLHEGNSIKDNKVMTFIFQMLDSLSCKSLEPLGNLDPFCTLHVASALMVTLSDQDLIISPGQVIARLYAVIEHVALR